MTKGRKKAGRASNGYLPREPHRRALPHCRIAALPISSHHLRCGLSLTVAANCLAQGGAGCLLPDFCPSSLSSRLCAFA